MANKSPIQEWLDSFLSGVQTEQQAATNPHAGTPADPNIGMGGPPPVQGPAPYGSPWPHTGAPVQGPAPYGSPWPHTTQAPPPRGPGVPAPAPRAPMPGVPAPAPYGSQWPRETAPPTGELPSPFPMAPPRGEPAMYSPEMFTRAPLRTEDMVTHEVERGPVDPDAAPYGVSQLPAERSAMPTTGTIIDELREVFRTHEVMREEDFAKTMNLPFVPDPLYAAGVYHEQGALAYGEFAEGYNAPDPVTGMSKADEQRIAAVSSPGLAGGFAPDLAAVGAAAVAYAPLAGAWWQNIQRNPNYGVGGAARVMSNAWTVVGGRGSIDQMWNDTLAIAPSGYFYELQALDPEWGAVANRIWAGSAMVVAGPAAFAIDRFTGGRLMREGMLPDAADFYRFMQGPDSGLVAPISESIVRGQAEMPMAQQFVQAIGFGIALDPFDIMVGGMGALRAGSRVSRRGREAGKMLDKSVNAYASAFTAPVPWNDAFRKSFVRWRDRLPLVGQTAATTAYVTHRDVPQVVFMASSDAFSPSVAGDSVLLGSADQVVDSFNRFKDGHGGLVPVEAGPAVRRVAGADVPVNITADLGFKDGRRWVMLEEVGAADEAAAVLDPAAAARAPIPDPVALDELRHVDGSDIVGVKPHPLGDAPKVEAVRRSLVDIDPETLPSIVKARKDKQPVKMLPYQLDLDDATFRKIYGDAGLLKVDDQGRATVELPWLWKLSRNVKMMESFILLNTGTYVVNNAATNNLNYFYWGFNFGADMGKLMDSLKGAPVPNRVLEFAEDIRLANPSMYEAHVLGEGTWAGDAIKTLQRIPVLGHYTRGIRKASREGAVTIGKVSIELGESNGYAKLYAQSYAEFRRMVRGAGKWAGGSDRLMPTAMPDLPPDLAHELQAVVDTSANWGEVMQRFDKILAGEGGSVVRYIEGDVALDSYEVKRLQDLQDELLAGGATDEAIRVSLMDEVKRLQADVMGVAERLDMQTDGPVKASEYSVTPGRFSDQFASHIIPGFEDESMEVGATAAASYNDGVARMASMIAERADQPYIGPASAKVFNDLILHYGEAYKQADRILKAVYDSIDGGVPKAEVWPVYFRRIKEHWAGAGDDLVLLVDRMAGDLDEYAIGAQTLDARYDPLGTFSDMMKEMIQEAGDWPDPKWRTQVIRNRQDAMNLKLSAWQEVMLQAQDHGQVKYFGWFSAASQQEARMVRKAKAFVDESRRALFDGRLPQADYDSIKAEVWSGVANDTQGIYRELAYHIGLEFLEPPTYSAVEKMSEVVHVLSSWSRPDAIRRQATAAGVATATAAGQAFDYHLVATANKILRNYGLEEIATFNPETGAKVVRSSPGLRELTLRQYQVIQEGFNKMAAGLEDGLTRDEVMADWFDPNTFEPDVLLPDGLTRNQLFRRFVDVFKRPPGEVAGDMSLIDAYAERWAKVTGRQPYEFYPEKFAGVDAGIPDHVMDRVFNQSMPADSVGLAARVAETGHVPAYVSPAIASKFNPEYLGGVVEYWTGMRAKLGEGTLSASEMWRAHLYSVVEAMFGQGTVRGKMKAYPLNAFNANLQANGVPLPGFDYRSLGVDAEYRSQVRAGDVIETWLRGAEGSQASALVDAGQPVDDLLYEQLLSQLWPFLGEEYTPGLFDSSETFQTLAADMQSFGVVNWDTLDEFSMMELGGTYGAGWANHLIGPKNLGEASVMAYLGETDYAVGLYKAMLNVGEQYEKMGAIHSLNRGSFMRAMDLGGFAAPSMAIQSVGNIQDAKNFGDIVLVPSPSMVDPSLGKARTFSTDIWSQSFPGGKHAQATMREKGFDPDNLDDIARYMTTDYDPLEGTGDAVRGATATVGESEFVRTFTAEEFTDLEDMRRAFREGDLVSEKQLAKWINSRQRPAENAAITALEDVLPADVSNAMRVKMGLASYDVGMVYRLLLDEVYGNYVMRHGADFQPDQMIQILDDVIPEVGQAVGPDEFGNISDEMLELMGRLEDGLLVQTEGPSAYFEAKALVSYQLSDFPAAVIPDAQGYDEVIQYLRRHGVPFWTYDLRDKASFDQAMYQALVETNSFFQNQNMGEVWYSSVARAVEKMQRRMPADQALAWITKQAGVKKGEMDWSIGDWLRSKGDGLVTRAEVQAQLGIDGVKLEETWLGVDSVDLVELGGRVPPRLQAAARAQTGYGDSYSDIQAMYLLSGVNDPVTRIAIEMDTPEYYRVFEWDRYLGRWNYDEAVGRTGLQRLADKVAAGSETNATVHPMRQEPTPALLEALQGYSADRSTFYFAQGGGQSYYVHASVDAYGRSNYWGLFAKNGAAYKFVKSFTTKDQLYEFLGSKSADAPAPTMYGGMVSQWMDSPAVSGEFSSKRELLFHWDPASSPAYPEGAGYKAAHFGPERSKNLAFHARLQDYVYDYGAGKQRVLWVDEVQSDWVADLRPAKRLGRLEAKFDGLDDLSYAGFATTKEGVDVWHPSNAYSQAQRLAEAELEAARNLPRYPGQSPLQWDIWQEGLRFHDYEGPLPYSLSDDAALQEVWLFTRNKLEGANVRVATADEAREFEWAIENMDSVKTVNWRDDASGLPAGLQLTEGNRALDQTLRSLGLHEGPFGSLVDGHEIVLSSSLHGDDPDFNMDFFLQAKGESPHLTGWRMAVDEDEARFVDSLSTRFLERAGDVPDDEMIYYARSGGIPELPFENTWHEVAMKRLLRYAAEGGYDELMWIDGNNSVRRNAGVYNDVERINYGEEDRLLEVIQGGVSHTQDDVTPGNLPGIIGRDAAELLLAKPAGEGVRSIQGSEVFSVLVDPELSTSFHRMLYDEWLPRFMTKYTKKWGGEVLPGSLDDTGRQFGWTLAINDDMREAVGRGQPMFSGGLGGNKDARAAIWFKENGQAVIAALTNTDASSIPHELAHLFLESERALAVDTGDARVLDDLRILEEWAGVTEGRWTREAHERVAEGFERYLVEGKAPTKALQRVFDNFKQWLMAVYGSVMRAGIPISPQVRSVYASWMGGDLQEIGRMRATQTQLPVRGPASVQGVGSAVTPPPVPGRDARTTRAGGPAADTRGNVQIGLADMESGKLGRLPTGTLEIPPENRGVLGMTGVGWYDPANPMAVQYEAVRAGDMVASNHANGLVNPVYPQIYQPKDRTQAASMAQTDAYAKDLRGNAFWPTYEFMHGPPTLDPQNNILNGNGRYIGYLKASPEMQVGLVEDFAAHADLYGLDPDPILASLETGDPMQYLIPGRRLLSEVDLPEFARRVDSAGTLQLNIREFASEMSRHLTPSLMAQLVPGQADSLSEMFTQVRNSNFVRLFFSKMSTEEAARYADANLELNAQGIDLIEASLFHLVYGENKVLIDELLMAPVQTLANLKKALQLSLAPMATIKAGIGAGQIDAAFDISGYVSDAALRVVMVRQTDSFPSVGAYIASMPLFEELPLPVASLMRSMEEHKLAPRELAYRLNLYAERVQKLGSRGALEGAGQVDPQKVLDESLLADQLGLGMFQPPTHADSARHTMDLKMGNLESIQRGLRAETDFASSGRVMSEVDATSFRAEFKAHYEEPYVQGQLAAAMAARDLTDRAMVDYGVRHGFNNVFDLFLGYTFWYTHAGWEYAQRMLKNPAFIMTYMRLDRELGDRREEEGGLRPRFHDKWRIPLPEGIMPEGHEDVVYMPNPLKAWLPFAQFFESFNYGDDEPEGGWNIAQQFIRAYREVGGRSRLVLQAGESAIMGEPSTKVLDYFPQAQSIQGASALLRRALPDVAKKFIPEGGFGFDPRFMQWASYLINRSLGNVAMFDSGLADVPGLDLTDPRSVLEYAQRTGVGDVAAIMPYVEVQMQIEDWEHGRLTPKEIDLLMADPLYLRSLEQAGFTKGISTFTGSFGSAFRAMPLESGEQQQVLIQEAMGAVGYDPTTGEGSREARMAIFDAFPESWARIAQYGAVPGEDKQTADGIYWKLFRQVEGDLVRKEYDDGLRALMASDPGNYAEYRKLTDALYAGYDRVSSEVEAEEGEGDGYDSLLWSVRGASPAEVDKIRSEQILSVLWATRPAWDSYNDSSGQHDYDAYDQALAQWYVDLPAIASNDATVMAALQSFGTPGAQDDRLALATTQEAMEIYGRRHTTPETAWFKSVRDSVRSGREAYREAVRLAYGPDIFDLSSAYGELSASEKREFLKVYPQLIDYWDGKAALKAEHLFGGASPNEVAALVLAANPSKGWDIGNLRAMYAGAAAVPADVLGYDERPSGEVSVGTLSGDRAARVGDLVQDFRLRDERVAAQLEEEFPGVKALSDAYSALPKDSDGRRAFLRDHPELREYWSRKDALEREALPAEARSRLDAQDELLDPYQENTLAINERMREIYGDSYAMLDMLQSAFFELPKDTGQRAAFLKAYPILLDFWRMKDKVKLELRGSALRDYDERIAAIIAPFVAPPRRTYTRRSYGGGGGGGGSSWIYLPKYAPRSRQVWRLR